MNTLINASPELVVGKYDGATYKFLPNEPVDIFNAYAAKHLLNRWGKYGVVDVTFSKENAAKFLDYALFVHHQKIEGLKNFLGMVEEKYQSYLVYDMECGTKETVERFKFRDQREKVQNNLKALTKSLEEIKSVDTTDIMRSRAEELRAQAEKLIQQAETISKGMNRGGNALKSAGLNPNRTERSERVSVA